jgi:hypothetical protein
LSRLLGVIAAVFMLVAVGLYLAACLVAPED